MRINVRGLGGLAIGILGALLVTAPALAQHGGVGHSSGGGGGHFSGGGHASSGGHAAAAYAGGGARYGAGGHWAGSSGSHWAGSNGSHYGGSYGHGLVGGPGYGGHSAYGYPSGGYQHGYSTGAFWGGGYWRGGYWPRAYYGLGYAWFLPILPLAYATYWYSGIPYYYANDVYYTWNPDYSGYTATDPPPVTDPATSGAPQPAPMASAGPDSGAAQIFMYPKNGQTEAQQSTDKRECQDWAASQAGAANTSDYRRAMMACLEGRGYSAN